MARLHLTVGTRYEQGAQVYVVRQLLPDDRLLVENQSFGGQAIHTRDEVSAAWASGALVFEVHGARTRPSPTSSLATSYTIADIAHLPETQRAEAWRRYTLIAPLLALAPHERTREVVDAHVAAQRVGPHARAGARSRVSRASVRRYLRAFEESGGDLRALVPATATQGGRGSTRLHPDLEAIVQGVLAECAAAPRYRTLRDVYLLVAGRVRDVNHQRPADDHLALPGRTSLYRRVRQAGATTILCRRASAIEAHADAGVQPGAGPRTTHVLERVEMDDTPLDLILVDEEDRLPIGRPTVTLALDVYSAFPTGVYVGFEPAGYGAAMRCLLHSILPKEDTRTRYGTTQPWPVHGVPETLVVDHAPHLIGADLRDACGQLGIRFAPAPVRRPWLKGAIERQFRTHNTGLIHTLPGTTFSNVLQRGDYDATGHACISLTRFWEILHVYLLDFYAQDSHRGIDGVPARRWAESVAAGWTPALHHDAREVRIILGRAATRTIQRTGIDVAALRYQSPALQELRQRLPTPTVTLKYDPEDLGALHVYDPASGGQWLRVPALDQAYAGGLSLWKHRVIRGYALRTMHDGVDIYALATAKERIQTIVDDEFRRTRRVKGRRTLARAKGIGVPAEQDAPAEQDTPAAGPAAVGALPVAAPPRLVVLPPYRSDEAAGFGGDYNLPR